MNVRAIGMAGLLMLGACDAFTQPEPQPKVAAQRLPAQVCDQVLQAVQKLSKSAGFDQRAKGEATVEEAAWLQMSADQREQLTKVLAYDAACAAEEPPLEETVTIRNEGGRVLTQRVVETSADLGKILEE